MDQIYSSLEYKQKLSDNWKKPEYREKVLAIWSDPLYKDLFIKDCSIRTKEMWTRPAYREKMRLIWENEVFRQRMAIARANMPRISSLQVRLYELLEMFGVKFCKEGVETVIGPYTFDCLVPKQGSMQKDLLIECHGEYFHNKEVVKSRDKSKLTYINEYFPDFEVRVLWEQWFCFRGKVESQLREWLGLVEPIEQVDFSFEDVVIGNPSYKDSVDFLSKYHYLYTCPRGSLYYGAYLKSELVAVCLLSPPVRQNIASSIKMGLKSSDVLELSRFCIHPKFHKRNFASWFLSRVLRIQDKVIFSYSDSTVGHDGGIYKATGFVMDRVVDPDYWYVDGEGWVVHKRTLYGRAIRMSMVEREYAEKHGFRKVFGGVKYRFVWGL